MRSRRSFIRLLALSPAAPMLRADASDTAPEFAQRIFARINEIRLFNGSSKLAWSDALAECAREQSIRKVELRFPGHEDPQRGGVSDRLHTAGIDWSHCGENLFMERGWDDPVNYALVCWWYSPGHQANLLNPDFTETGVGLAQADDGTWFVTQIFRTPPPPPKFTAKHFR